MEASHSLADEGHMLVSLQGPQYGPGNPVTRKLLMHSPVGHGSSVPHLQDGGLVDVSHVSALAKQPDASMQEQAGCPGMSRQALPPEHGSKLGELGRHWQVGGSVVVLM